VPEEKVIRLDMSVADGFKYIISIGAISQERLPATLPPLKEPEQAALKGPVQTTMFKHD